MDGMTLGELMNALAEPQPWPDRGTGGNVCKSLA